MAPEELLRRHRKNGILIDSNLLLLYLIGNTNRNRISSFKRTQKYTSRDFDLISRTLAQFEKVITTPHILTEVSNLARPLGAEQRVLTANFSHWIEVAQERFEASREVAGHGVFSRLGLTDASYRACHAQGDPRAD